MCLLPECVHPLGKRDDDADERTAVLHTLALHLHHRTEWPEEYELCEVLWAVARNIHMVIRLKSPKGAVSAVQTCFCIPVCVSLWLAN